MSNDRAEQRFQCALKAFAQCDRHWAGPWVAAVIKAIDAFDATPQPTEDAMTQEPDEDNTPIEALRSLYISLANRVTDLEWKLRQKQAERAQVEQFVVTDEAVDAAKAAWDLANSRPRATVNGCWKAALAAAAQGGK